VIDRLRERTGTQAVLIDRVPLDYWRAPAVRVLPAFRDAAEMGAGIRVMSAGALTYIGADLIAGREFREGDREGATRTAVVNESLASRLSAAGGSPIGAFLTVTWRDEPHGLQVVGVVRDLRDSVYRPVGPELYVSAAQFPQPRATFVIRGERSPDEVAAALRQALREVDPRQALSDVVAVSDRVRTYTALSRFVGILLIVFAALAVLLAATGVLAVLAGAVASRTREIGIRIAVGATRLDVVSCLSREFIPALAAGAVAGAAASYSLSSVLRSLVPGVSPVHPAAYGMAIAGVVAIAVAGAWWPVRRALGIDPALVLTAPEEW
jgi:putative ABC transport system permease protein